MRFLLLNAPSRWVHSLEAKRSMSQSETMRAGTTWCLHEGWQQAGTVAYVAVAIRHAAPHTALQLVQLGLHFVPQVGIWLLE